MLFRCICVVLLAGCGTIPDGKGGETQYIGAASPQVEAGDDTDKQITRQDATIFGIWWDLNSRNDLTGGGFGYRKFKTISAPLDCSLVIFVDNEAQLDSVRALIKSYYKEGQSPCIEN